jgi:hypothetical protein
MGPAELSPLLLQELLLIHVLKVARIWLWRSTITTILPTIMLHHLLRRRLLRESLITRGHRRIRRALCLLNQLRW